MKFRATTTNLLVLQQCWPLQIFQRSLANPNFLGFVLKIFIIPPPKFSGSATVEQLSIWTRISLQTFFAELALLVTNNNKRNAMRECKPHQRKRWRVALQRNGTQRENVNTALEMATVQRTRPRAVGGAPRRAAWQLKSALRHSVSAAPRTIIFLHFVYNYCWWFSLYGQQ